MKTSDQVRETTTKAADGPQEDVESAKLERATLLEELLSRTPGGNSDEYPYRMDRLDRPKGN